MAEKTLNSRIQLKHDTEANLRKAENFIPKMGEAILYDADDNYSCVRIKIGNGVTLINDLPFAVDYNETIADIKIEGTVLSYTKGNGATNSYDIQDTTYAQATAEILGLVKLYGTTGQNTDGTMTQKAITDELNKKVSLNISNSTLVFSI
jgi:hypothetical protein